MSKITSAEAHKSAKKIVFLTVFLDLVGFGIYITLSTYLAQHFTATAYEIGWLMACYSIAQFLFAPFWGRWSDRIGRRPVLLISLLGGSLSYLALAFSPSLGWMFFWRTLSGAFAANISTAHAYISDITDEKDRAAGMGMIGAAFGLGFIIGPVLGSLFYVWGEKLGTESPYGIFFPSFMAFVITFLNFLWALRALPETSDKKPYKAQRFEWLKVFTRTSLLTYLILVFFFANFAMPLMEVMLFPFVSDRFFWSLKEAGMGFAYVGLIMVFTQGYLVRKLLPQWGERKLLMVGMVLLTASFYMIALSGTIAWLAVAMTVLAVGNGFVRPSLLGMVSLLASKEQQGLVMGASQSAASLGRIFGPIAGGALYVSIGMESPFIAAGSVTFLGLLILIFKYSNLPDQRRKNV